MNTAPPDIFLSFAHEDLEWVRPLAAELERRGWRVFWDRRIPAGKSWRSHLGTRLESARCVIVVWSEHAAAQKFVLQESACASSSGGLGACWSWRWPTATGVPAAFIADQIARGHNPARTRPVLTTRWLPPWVAPLPRCGSPPSTRLRSPPLPTRL